MASRDLRIVNMAEGQKVESDKVIKRIGEISYRNIGALSKIGIFDTGKALITNGLRVVSGGGMTVSIPLGNIIQRLPSGDLLPCLSSINQTLTMDSASGVPRIDTVECQVKSIIDKNDTSGSVLDPTTGIISVETIKRDVKYYLAVQKKTGSTTVTPATAGVLSGTVGIAGTIDLSVTYLLNIADGEDGSFQEIDLRGATPQATTLAEIISAINTSTGRVMASIGGGNVCLLTGYGTGETSYFEIKPPVSNSDADALNAVFGTSISGAYDYVYKGTNDWIKLAEIDIGASTTVITSGLIRNIDQKSTWASDSTNIITSYPALMPLSQRSVQATIGDTDLIPIETALGASLYCTALNLRQGTKNLIVPITVDIDTVIADADIYTHYLLAGAGANKTFTLPTLADNQNKIYTLYNNDSTHMLTVDGEGTETIDGMATIQLPKQGNYITVIGTATEWKIIGESIFAQLRLDVYSGYGGTDTKIPRFTTLTEYIGNMFSHNHTSGYSSNAKGLEIVINRSGKYSITSNFSGDFMHGGITLNSAALTTSIASITDTTRLTDTMTDQAAGTAMSAIEKNFILADVIRPHTDGSAANPANRWWVIFSYVGK